MSQVYCHITDSNVLSSTCHYSMSMCVCSIFYVSLPHLLLCFTSAIEFMSVFFWYPVHSILLSLWHILSNQWYSWSIVSLKLVLCQVYWDFLILYIRGRTAMMTQATQSLQTRLPRLTFTRIQTCTMYMYIKVYMYCEIMHITY